MDETRQVVSAAAIVAMALACLLPFTDVYTVHKYILFFSQVKVSIQGWLELIKVIRPL